MEVSLSSRSTTLWLGRDLHQILSLVESKPYRDRHQLQCESCRFGNARFQSRSFAVCMIQSPARHLSIPSTRSLLCQASIHDIMAVNFRINLAYSATRSSRVVGHSLLARCSSSSLLTSHSQKDDFASICAKSRPFYWSVQRVVG